MNVTNYQIINLTSVRVEKSRLIRQIKELNLDPSWSKPFTMSMTKNLRVSVSPFDKTLLVRPTIRK